MNKLKEYLKRKNISFSDTSIGTNYFYNHALDLHFDAVSVCFYFNPENHEEALETAKARETLERYVKRYGYTITMSCGYANDTRYVIARTDEVKRLREYHLFSDKSKKSCEKHIHFCAQYYGKAGNNKNLDEELKGIMQFYEDEYKRFLNGEEIDIEYYKTA